VIANRVVHRTFDGTVAMLNDYLAANREELVRRCLAKAAGRPDSQSELESDARPAFVDQLISDLCQSVIELARDQGALAAPVAPGEGAAHEELRELVRQSPVPTVIWRGPQHVYSIVNEAHDRMLGKRVLGKSIREAHTEAEAGSVFTILDDVYRTGTKYESKAVMYRIHDEHGRPRSIWVHEWFLPLRDAQGAVVAILGMSQDVTEEVQARIEVSASLEHLEEERDLRERFVTALTHDLRTPLSAASMGAYLLSQQSTDPQAVVRLAALVATNIERVDKMIVDLLDANRLHAGQKLDVELEHCVLNEIASETLDELGSVHGTRFALRAASKIDGYWSGTSIRRVLENLCNNAIKYGAAHRPVTVSLVQRDDFAVIEVHNEGPAISPRDLATLFDHHQRAASARRGRERGWGIGLTLVRGIATAHGGRATVESSADTGTTFRVTLRRDARTA
jgi:signal transduction histidine kinase